MDHELDNHITPEMYGLHSDPSACVEIAAKDKKYDMYKQASHVLLFAPTDKIALKLHPRIAVVFMQMRFDGYLGFPGGLVDEGENPTQAVNRELEEELGYNHEKHGEICDDDHLFTHVDKAKRLVLHFYAKELTEEKTEEIMIESALAKDYGDESLGLVHVPLYTMSDSYRGLPAFLQHNFIGNAKQQLTMALTRLNLLSEIQIKKALKATPQSIS